MELINSVSHNDQIKNLLQIKQTLESQIENLKMEVSNARMANETKDQFLANMSHEIRTPLSAILGFASLMANQNITAQERDEFSRAITRNSDHLLGLIDEILDFSKIAAGKVCIERVQFSPLEIINGLVDFFSAQIHAKSLKIRVHSSVAPSTYVISDSLKFQQIVTNLLSNAVKFTDKGSIDINFNICLVEDKPVLILEVRDSGIGIHEDHQQKLFSPFVQADSSLNRKYGGTGLGLALSRRLAEALGGKLELTLSEVNKGSVFTLNLPIELSHSQELPVCPEPKKNFEMHKQTLSGIRILIADDSPDNRFLFKKLLEQVSAEVELVNDGQEAVEICKSKSFDVILMDIQMPNLDGYEATRRIRRNGFTKPILALTAHALDQELRKIEIAGCNGRILKPAKIEDLVSGIVAALHC